MADLKADSALNALNEKDYINKLYDSNNKTQQDLLKQNYTDGTAALNQEQSRVQQQTQEHVNRTQVEAQGAQNQYTGPKLSLAAKQQERLSRDNAKQSNVSSLQQKQSQADAEIERQRQLLARQYETAIQQARAENDMQKAQQLYEAAKAEEAKLLALKQSASTALAEKEDTTIRDSLLKGETPTSDYSGTTWEQVLKNEASINEIYDKQMEAERLGLQTEWDQAMSDLEAKRKLQQAQTDQKLTDAYVDALRKQKNYAEVQTAYGQGSGTAGAARIAQDTELQKTLTSLRGVQTGADAGLGMEGFDIGQKYRDKLYMARKETEQKRAEELLKAAEQEEENLYNTQLQIGQELSKKNDWSILGKLYGLTQDQIDRLQGTGAYAPRGGEDYSGGRSAGRNIAKEVALATVRDSSGNPAENSAYWNSQKTQAYYGKLK